MDPQTQNPPQVPAPVPASEPPAAPADVLPQVVSAIQNGKNVLVTVGSNPTVDELASAIGLTFLLGKLDKHATAVFSGKIPPAMEFLDPEKVFENSVDSLRDFIIALDKEKADKLRYKVEDDVVKIFITPYKTIISEKDLNFSQGDFNVDVVIALGVEKREELDKAIIAHGRILHDASVITINAGNKTSALGSVDWNSSGASSTAEMLVNLADAFDPGLLDSQISTAFLTGIVAETNRFSNEKTSPKVMSLSAQLMAAGANQQLIASNLRQEGMISEPVRKKDAEQPHDDDGEMVLDHKPQDLDSTEVEPEKEEKPEAKKSSKPKEGEKANEDNKTAKEPEKPQTTTEKKAEKLKETVDKAAAQEPAATTQVENSDTTDSTPALPSEPETKDKATSTTEPEAETKKPRVIEPLPSLPPDPTVEPVSSEPPSITPLEASHKPIDKPTFGGTLNATTAGAEEDQVLQAEREAAVNNLALSHDDSSAEPMSDPAALEAAREAVEAANVDQPFNPANNPLQALNAQPLPATEPDNSVDTSVSELQSTAAPLPAPSAPAPAANESDPVDAFMQPHSSAAEPPSLNALTPPTPVMPPSPGAPVPNDIGLPPLPPLPTAAGSDGAAVPPMPPLPGQPGSDPAAQFQPQINPGFMQDMQQSQNQWTQAGDDLAAKQQEKDAVREQKMDQMNQQYDQAVDRNRELQGLPPLNNPNGTGLPPLNP